MKCVKAKSTCGGLPTIPATKRHALAGLCGILLAVLPAYAQDGVILDEESAALLFPTKQPYSPYAGRSFPTRPFFGDTHLHTTLSFDAGMVGCMVGPEDAYRFARGEEVVSSTGQRVKLSRPLDFLVVSDHSDNMGFAPDFISGAPNILANPLGRRWYTMVKAGEVGEASNEILQAFGAGTFPEELKYKPGTPPFRSTWQRIIQAAEDANAPGRFTAFIGYEWTSMSSGNNLHRNVVFRDGGDRAGQVEPYITEPPLGSNDPRDLWKWMSAYETKTGGDVLAIAHNGNVSNGIMFPLIEPGTGRAIDLEYAKERMRWERLYEVVQTKGDSETHPLLSPNDEFANYETWDKGNLDLSSAKKNEMLEFEYARSALKNGLKAEARLGVNPFKIGLIGSTDSHVGLSAVEEDSFMGKMATSEPSEHRWDHTFIANPNTGLSLRYWETVSAGFAAVWATENTREAIFDAMERRETYATTGSRMAVRMFGGWDFVPEDANSRMPARIGYTKGVPMGGDMTDAPTGKAPTFLVAALKDPLGANLDRIQIIKGWLDNNGETQEKVYDVVWGDADKRKRGADGKVPSVGSTVDLANASWTNTIGDTELITVWKDPDFNPTLRAFYYVRVIEIPTPRWTAYDVKYYGIKMSPEVPMTTTERAYTSPIWYTPSN